MRLLDDDTMVASGGGISVPMSLIHTLLTMGGIDLCMLYECP